ncbi:unnamed protein product [Symbiodinium natans]|uniref:Uncharacterized protein n=1 Tax=Symbiodinium natans TaxID=878477 RepID=A0A812UCQ5_9DINO|nr:unnamed protein product [Symbiodinium natans]
MSLALPARLAAMAATMAALLALASAAAAGCHESGCEPYEQAALLQVTGKSSASHASRASLWPFPGLARREGGTVEQSRLEGVHKVHADIEKLALQQLAELEARNLSDYNLSRDDFGLTNTTLSLLNTVLTEMGSLLTEINASHIADEQLLLDLAEGFVQCNVDLSVRQAMSQNLSSIVNDSSNAHDTCRSTEQTLAAENASAWAAYHGYGSQSQPGSESLPQDVVDCIQNFLNGYSPQTDAHLQSMIDCAATIQSWTASFTQNMTGLRDAYFASLYALNNHSEDCRVNQSTLESHFCEYHQQLTDSCAATDSCFANVNETWHELLDSVAASSARREASYIAASKVICYIQVLQSNLTHPAVQACQDLVVDTSGIAVSEPTPAGKGACDTSPVAEFPCEESWVQAEYESKTWYTQSPQILPDTCISCAARTSTTTTAAPVALLAGVGQTHTTLCALDDGVASKLKCVGRNDDGEVGDPDSVGHVDLGPGRVATSVEGGRGFHFCALDDVGEMKCWGKNTQAQLGLGDLNSKGDGTGEG